MHLSIVDGVACRLFAKYESVQAANEYLIFAFVLYFVLFTISLSTSLVTV